MLRRQEKMNDTKPNKNDSNTGKENPLKNIQPPPIRPKETRNRPESGSKTV